MIYAHTIGWYLGLARLHSKFWELALHMKKFVVHLIINCSFLGQCPCPITLAIWKRLFQTFSLLRWLIADLLQLIIETFKKTEFGEDVVFNFEIVGLDFANCLTELPNLWNEHFSYLLRLIYQVRIFLKLLLESGQVTFMTAFIWLSILF